VGPGYAPAGCPFETTPPEYPAALAFSADGNMLVMAGQQSLHTWRAASWAEIEAAEKKTEGKTQ
jgi:hypothetical protein